MIYKSKLIINNKKDFVKEIHAAADIHREAFPGKDLTWGYNLYNTFGITSPSKLFYELFKELRTVILNYTASKYGCSRGLIFISKMKCYIGIVMSGIFMGT